MKELRSLDKSVWMAVTVAALGYFVDIYDLLLFSVVRVASLKDLGVPDELMLEKGVLLINTQMAGLLIGGVLWGMLGDKRGRLSVLFGSIFLYSVANVANGFAQNVEQYAILRFIAGIGLAGELGAGITLISEILPQKIRGYGTSIVAAIGILGAVFGGLTGDHFHWRTAYFIGGAMGFLVLLLRVGVRESGMFHKVKGAAHIAKGNFFQLFQKRETFIKYICVILIGVPVWYVVGILYTFAPEFGKAMEMVDIPSAGKAVMFGYAGLAVGDFASGILCQWAQSRRKVIGYYLAAIVVLVIGHFFYAKISIEMFYLSCSLLGFAAGYWAMFVTVAAEQFGTNIRSTATTSAPNFVRAAVIPLTISFQYFKEAHGLITSALVVGAVTMVISFVALYFMQETFHKDLDYLE